MKGPYPIVCRGHSGSRLLCETFEQNRMWMGITNNDQKDTVEFGQGHGVIRELIKYGYRYDELDEDEKNKAHELMRLVVEKSKGQCPNPEDMVAYGWKRPVMVYTCEVFLNAYPEAKTIHLIRDGRDVMLSRLDSRMSRLHEPLNRIVVFGDVDVKEFNGEPLDLETVAKYRNEIEMTHWVTAVRVGMRARKYTDRYLEVRYEDLCTEPEKTMKTIFDFLDVPFRDEARDWVKANASTRAIGKWKGREAELADAIAVGEPLLKELGYT